MDEPEKVLLTSWLVEQHRLGVTQPEIFSTTLDEVKSRRHPTVHQRADLLLRYLESKSELLGNVVKYKDGSDEGNRLMAWTASRQIFEVTTLAEYANQEGWIEYRVTEPQLLSETDDLHELMLRPPGYARLAALDERGASTNQAFVAMWFDPSMNEAYEHGIAKAIRESGYEPLRIDRKDHNNKIDDEIIAEIRRSHFVVADFTCGDGGARGGVYYEAGFAHGLSIPVIFTCKADALEKLHFDTRQYNHIAWNNPDELKNLLSKRISSTLGDGPLKK